MSGATLPHAPAPARTAPPDYLFKPYAYYKDLPKDRLAVYFGRAIEESAGRPNARCWTLECGDRSVGLAQLEPLEWDSRALGRSAARLSWLIASGDYAVALERKRRLLAWVLDEVRRQGIEHLTARVPAGDLPALHALESCGFQTLDTILIFSRSAAAASASTDVRLAGPGDLPALRRIAESSFRCDRYHADPTISSETADRLHGDWVENSLRGFADAVLVAGQQGLPVGFTTLKIDRLAAEVLGVSIAAIVLVATAPQARGRGVARSLAAAALDWCCRHGVDRVEVGTQLRNIPACRLYTSVGFRMVAAGVSLRYASQAAPGT